MEKLQNFLAGVRILEEADSPINGHIVVKYDFAWKTHIQAGGLTQSGGVVEAVWKSTFKKLQNSKLPNFQSVLILGLGGGTIAKLVRKNFPRAKITGVDIDPIMIGLGKKYLKLEDCAVNIIVDDAFEFLTSHQSPVTRHYDLVCTDLYTGDHYPQKFETTKFINLVKKVLSAKGTAIFNRLYYGEKKPLAMKFLTKLEKVFDSVQVVHPEANIMFVGRHSHALSKKTAKIQRRKK